MYKGMSTGLTKGEPLRIRGLPGITCGLVVAFAIIFTACSIGGDLETLRKKLEEAEKPDLYTVSFHADGGIPAPAPQTV